MAAAVALIAAPRAAEAQAQPDPASPPIQAAPTAEPTQSPAPPVQVAQAEGAEEPAAEEPAAEERESRIELSGSIDGYYSYNFNRPDTGENPFRAFDLKDNQFSLALAELIVNKAPTPLGFHVRLAAGKTTDLVHAFEPGDRETYKHIMQAYGSYQFNRRGGTIDFGKWVTPHGAEVIETQDNWNYSRGILFSWAIPFYHAGIRVKTPLSDRLSGSLYITNGWNNVEDNNSDKTFGVGLSYALSPKLSLGTTWMGGREVVQAAAPAVPDDPATPVDESSPATPNVSRFRHLVDTILTYNASPKWSFSLNHDVAWQDGFGGSGDVFWTGLAGYARYAINDVSAAVLRAEWFWDRDGFATGTPQTMKEITATYERRIATNLITRLEFRHDWSSQPVFLDRSTPKKSQSTLLAGAIVLF